MRITIEGRELPGRRFVSDGVTLEHVHVGVQLATLPAGLVAGDASSAHWDLDVRTVVVDTGLDLRGDAVHGRRGERFLYLTWGDVGADGSFAMFRRAKLMIGDIDARLLADAAGTDGRLVAELALADECGGPVCGRVRPPLVSWRGG